MQSVDGTHWQVAEQVGICVPHMLPHGVGEPFAPGVQTPWVLQDPMLHSHDAEHVSVRLPHIMSQAATSRVDEGAQLLSPVFSPPH